MEFLFVLWWNVFEFSLNPTILTQNLVVAANHYEVMVLAEYNPEKVDKFHLVDLKKIMPYYYYFPYKDYSGGIAIFSKTELKNNLSNDYLSTGRPVLKLKHWDKNLIFSHFKQKWLYDTYFKNQFMKGAEVVYKTLFTKDNLVYEQMLELTSILNNKEKNVLIGDFNVFPKFLWKNTLPYDLLLDQGYQYHVTEKTWGHRKVKSIKNLPFLTLDQVFSNDNKIIDNVKIHYNFNSDHRPLEIRLKHRKNFK